MSQLDDSSLLELLDLTFDALCATRVSDWVDPDRVLAAVDLALTPERVTAWHARLVVPLRTLGLAGAALAVRSVARVDPLIALGGN